MTVEVLERLRTSAFELARATRETIRVAPFTVFIDHDQPLKYWSFAIPDAGAGPEATDALPALAEAFTAHERVGRIESFDQLSPQLHGVLEAAGWTRPDHVPVMVCTPETFTMASAPEGIEVLQVTADAAEDVVHEWHETQVIAFEDPLPHGPARVEWFRERAATRFLAAARIGGRIVATAECSPVTFGVTEVGGVATLAGHRRRGIGGFLTGTAVAAALAAGAEIAWLAAAEDGQRIYQRAGFSVAGSQSFYDAPPA